MTKICRQTHSGTATHEFATYKHKWVEKREYLSENRNQILTTWSGGWGDILEWKKSTGKNINTVKKFLAHSLPCISILFQSSYLAPPNVEKFLNGFVRKSREGSSWNRGARSPCSLSWLHQQNRSKNSCRNTWERSSLPLDQRSYQYNFNLTNSV